MGKVTAMESGKLGSGAGSELTWHIRGDREHGRGLCFRGPLCGGGTCNFKDGRGQWSWNSRVNSTKALRRENGGTGDSEEASLRYRRA